MPAPQRISVTPMPPQAGAVCKVCYDFSGTGLTSVKLVIAFVPSGSTTVTLTPASPCADVSVPANATGMEITDLTGTSPKFETQVL